MNNVDEGKGAAGNAVRARADVEFVVDGATISVAFSGADARDLSSSLEKAKRAIARLASLQEAELARQRAEDEQLQPHKNRVVRRGMPNVFEYWAYRRD